MFVEVNCARLRGDTAMSTLFGHRKGVFAGAASDRPGLPGSAGGGALFLDEIGGLGLDKQAMLLRALEERTFLSLGALRRGPQRLAAHRRHQPRSVLARGARAVPGGPARPHRAMDIPASAAARSARGHRTEHRVSARAIRHTHLPCRADDERGSRSVSRIRDVGPCPVARELS